MFSTGKNLILSTLGILCIPQNVWPGKALNIYINYSIYYPSRQHVKWKHFKYKFTLNNDFMMCSELILLWPEITLGDLIFNSKLLKSSCKISISCWKCFFPWHLSHNIYYEDVLIMTYYHTGISEYKILTNH